MQTTATINMPGLPSLVARPSDVDLDRLLHPVEPEEGQEDRSEEHDLADRLVEQRIHVPGVGRVDEQTEPDRQDAEDDGADLALRRERVDVATEALPLGH